MDTVSEKTKKATRTTGGPPAEVSVARGFTPSVKQAALELAGDYLRTHGMRDPNRIAGLANECVHEACALLAAPDAGASSLEEMTLRLACARLGLACDAAGLSGPAAASFTPEDVVPPRCDRVMPEQKLDELLPLAEPSLWRKVMRAGPATIAFVMTKVRLV